MTWRDISTAPRDGTLIDLTWFENGKPQEVWPMRWCHIQRNGLFPGKLGMWTTACGSLTWNDDCGAGPTHWRDLPSTTTEAERLAAMEGK